MKDPYLVQTIIEIPKGSRNKYEYDFELKAIRLDRVIPSSLMYPTDYGFIRETLSTDGDHLDILVFITEPTFPGCLVEARPIGVAMMEDDKGLDPKIIAVAQSDPHFQTTKTLEDLGVSYQNEIQHFFETYKVLEKKYVKFTGWDNLTKAKELISESQARYLAHK
jgi:inorganic pyrophosphatase